MACFWLQVMSTSMKKSLEEMEAIPMKIQRHSLVIEHGIKIKDFEDSLFLFFWRVEDSSFGCILKSIRNSSYEIDMELEDDEFLDSSSICDLDEEFKFGWGGSNVIPHWVWSSQSPDQLIQWFHQEYSPKGLLVQL
jgi:hypothetical protein